MTVDSLCLPPFHMESEQSKLFIWKCADTCCVPPLLGPLRWHAGTEKHDPFADFATFHRAISYFRNTWSKPRKP